MKHPVHIIRPLNLAIIATTMLIILIKYRDEQVADYWLKTVLLIFPALLSAASGYVVNDIYDVKTDKINKPGQMIIGISLKPATAWVIYAILSIVSVVVSYLFSQQYAIVNICILALLYLYAFQLKGVPLIGNMIVALCSAAVIACCILLIAFETQIAIINFSGYIFFAFFISLIRELVKDMQDMDGDRAAGYRTYPLVAGVKACKILIYVFTGIEIILCGLFSFLCWGFDLYAASILMGLITLFLFYFINHVAKTSSKEEYGNSSRLLKYIMFAGVITLIFV